MKTTTADSSCINWAVWTCLVALQKGVIQPSQQTGLQCVPRGREEWEMSFFPSQPWLNTKEVSRRG